MRFTKYTTERTEAITLKQVYKIIAKDFVLLIFNNMNLIKGNKDPSRKTKGHLLKKKGTKCINAFSKL